MTSHEATELQLYIENDGPFYRARTVPVLDNLAGKLRRGVFVRDLAERAFLNLATAGARDYVREHGSMADRFDLLFPMSARRECATALFDRYKEDIEERAGRTTAQQAGSV